MAEGAQVTEISAAEKLTALRAEQPQYIMDSFGTICGYAEHGAIVHYSATPETDATLKPEGLLLIDSGAQYLDGTTDITRTIALGEPTEQMKKDLPDDVKYSYGFDNTKFIRASIDEVKTTVYEAFILVIIIIFLFLRDWRVTLIPCIVIPVSLIGAFFVMYLAGFSINVLSMLARGACPWAWWWTTPS